jgi:hypothetical protein
VLKYTLSFSRREKNKKIPNNKARALAMEDCSEEEATRGGTFVFWEC